MRARLAATILILYVSPAFGQTASDIEIKYGKPVNAYSVSENIWMTPEYTADGQVCQMRLYPKRIAPGTNYLSRQLPFAELKVVLNELVPPRTRGPKKESFGLTVTGGGAAWTTYPYQNITFVYISALKITSVPPKPEPYDFPVQEFLSGGKPENPLPSDDDFSPSQASSTELVTIRWNGRRCAKQ
jgi:hypothetical protein